MAHITETATSKGTRYTVRWRPAPDKFRKRSFYVKREAERFADKVEREQADGNSTEPFAVRGKKFREVAERMLDAERPRLKQNTIDAYESAFNAHVFPEFGNRQINTITAADLDTFNAMMRTKPKADGEPRTETSVLGTYKAVARVLTYAYKHRLIAFNPCVAVARPKADTQEARFLSVAEVNRLMAYLSAQKPYDLLVRMAAYAGLRIGEVGALRIRDIDLRHGEIQVRLNRTETSKGLKDGTPKSKAGVRDVPILDETLLRDLTTYLRQHPHRDNLEADLWPGKTPGHTKINYDHAFRPKGFYRSTFKPACDAVGLGGLHFHELRHTFATLALESGLLTMYELSVAMGHDSEAVTNKIYAHIRKRDHTARRAAFSAFLAESATPAAPLRVIRG